MHPHYSIGFLLLWEIATLEAQAGTHECILPEHFFIALCKADDIPAGALREDGTEALREQASRIEGELRAVRRILESAGFDRVDARNRVRTLIGQPGRRPADGVWHRNSDARWCCDRAIRMAQTAGDGPATPAHLLKAMADPEADFPVLDQIMTVTLRETLRRG